MGLWDVTKRMIQGKPAFEAPKSDDNDNWDDDAPTTDFAEDREAKRSEKTNQTLYDQEGNKHIPVVGVVHTKYTMSGANTEVWATIHNHSERRVALDKIMLLGQRTDLDYELGPGLQRDFRVYHGPRMTHDNYKKAELYYKDVLSGDYFRADHLIGYKYETDKTYDVDELELLTPINDV